MENNISSELQTAPQRHLHPGIWPPVLLIITAAVGYLIWASQSKAWPFEELPPTPSLSKEGEKGEFQDWQTYRNEEHGYEIKYPANENTFENLFNPSERLDPANVRILNIELANKSIECKCGEFASVVINVQANPGKLSSEDFLKANYRDWVANYEDFVVNEPITFAGEKGRRFGTEREKFILTTNDRYAYIISEGEAEKDDQILSTFKFTK